MTTIWAFIVILDGEVRNIVFGKSEAAVESARAAWLNEWAAENEFEEEDIDELGYAASDDGYDICIVSGDFDRNDSEHQTFA